MIYQIISHIPTWVIALFFVLIYLGLQQAQARVVTIKRMVILPIAMLGLSLSGVWNTFHQSSNSLVCWTIALALGAIISFTFTANREVRFLSDTRTLRIPGSWLPLCLMMAIFITKFAVGFSTARNPALLDSSEFVAVSSFFYGLWSGMFSGRTLKIVAPHARQLVPTSSV